MMLEAVRLNVFMNNISSTFTFNQPKEGLTLQIHQAYSDMERKG
jgi:hypothetical protein